jgi:hypothetical protein
MIRARDRTRSSPSIPRWTRACSRTHVAPAPHVCASEQHRPHVPRQAEPGGQPRPPRRRHRRGAAVRGGRAADLQPAAHAAARQQPGAAQVRGPPARGPVPQRRQAPRALRGPHQPARLPRPRAARATRGSPDHLLRGRQHHRGTLHPRRARLAPGGHRHAGPRVPGPVGQQRRPRGATPATATSSCWSTSSCRCARASWCSWWASTRSG